MNPYVSVQDTRDCYSAKLGGVHNLDVFRCGELCDKNTECAGISHTQKGSKHICIFKKDACSVDEVMNNPNSDFTWYPKKEIAPKESFSTWQNTVRDAKVEAESIYNECLDLGTEDQCSLIRSHAQWMLEEEIERTNFVIDTKTPKKEWKSCGNTKHALSKEECGRLQDCLLKNNYLGTKKGEIGINHRSYPHGCYELDLDDISEYWLDHTIVYDHTDETPSIYYNDGKDDSYDANRNSNLICKSDLYSNPTYAQCKDDVIGKYDKVHDLWKTWLQEAVSSEEPIKKIVEPLPLEIRPTQLGKIACFEGALVDKGKKDGLTLESCCRTGKSTNSPPEVCFSSELKPGECIEGFQCSEYWEKHCPGAVQYAKYKGFCPDKENKKPLIEEPLDYHLGPHVHDRDIS